VNFIIIHLPKGLKKKPKTRILKNSPRRPTLRARKTKRNNLSSWSDLREDLKTCGKTMIGRLGRNHMLPVHRPEPNQITHNSRRICTYSIVVNNQSIEIQIFLVFQTRIILKAVAILQTWNHVIPISGITPTLRMRKT